MSVPIRGIRRARGRRKATTSSHEGATRQASAWTRTRPLFAVLIMAVLLADGWGWSGPVGSADGFSLTASWEEGPVEDGIPLGEDARRLRVPVAVTLPAHLSATDNLPVRMTLDIRDALERGGWPMDGAGNPQGFSLDLGSVVVRAVDENGQPHSDERIPVQVFPGSFDDTRSFDPVAEPRITLRWNLDGTTERGDTRYFYVYFDSETRGERRAATYPDQEMLPLAQSAGPGRGNQVYVPFYGLTQSRGEQEERHVRIVNLADGQNSIRVWEYTHRDRPESQPASEFTLDGLGDAKTYKFGRDGQTRSEGRLFVDADALVFVEVFKSSPASPFIPALNGGLTGHRFVHNPDPSFFGDLYLLCGTPVCKGTLTQGGTQGIDLQQARGDNPRVRLDLAGGTPAEIVLTEGRAAVQAVTGLRSPAYWPSLTPAGPLDRSLMMGYADPGDGLMVLSESNQARLHLQPMGREPLTENQALPLGPLQHRDVANNPLGVGWSSAPWLGDLHEPEIVRAMEPQGNGGLHVASGMVSPGSDGSLSALMTPETPDGGLTYTAYLPGTRDTTFGEIVVFAPYPGTTVEAERRTETGTSRETLGPLRQHEVTAFDERGYYEINADRPVLVAWLRHHGNYNMGGLGLGVTELTETTTGPAQFTGPVFDLVPDRSVITGRPGQLVEFRVDITNLGRTVDGQGIADTAHLSVEAPRGWQGVQVVPSTVHLDPDAFETVTVQARVPTDADPGAGGASLRLNAGSASDPSYTAASPLRVNFEVHRDVEVMIDDQPVESQREILFGEVATYEVEVTNRGSLPDRFRLEVANATGAWESTFVQIQPTPDVPKSESGERPTQTPRLDPGESALYALDIQMTAERASRLITQIQATSETDRSVRDTVRAVTAFAADRSFRILVEDPVRLTPPGETEIYNVTVINEADVNEEFRITTTSITPEGWSASRIEWRGVGDIERLNHTVRLDPHETIHLDVERPVPTDSTPGDLALDRLRFQSTFRPPEEAGTDVVLRTTTDRLPGFTAHLDPGTLIVVPGERVTANLMMESTANADQKIRLNPLAPRDGGWDYRDENDDPPPWSLDLGASETREFPVEIHVPPNAPPFTHEPTRLVLQATTPGVGTPIVVEAGMEVAERVSANIEPRLLFANPGRWVENQVTVRNEGNVPLQVRAGWDENALPDGWRVETEERTLEVEETRTVPLRLFAPAGAPEERRTLALEWFAGTGRMLTSGNWDLDVGIPSMSVRIEDLHAAGGSLVIPVWVTNDGLVSVHNVNVQLMDGDTVIDRVALHQILPGKESVAPLVAPRDADALSVRVTADHEPHGIHADPTGAIARFAQQQAEGASVPAAGLPLLLLAALLALRVATDVRHRRGSQ